MEISGKVLREVEFRDRLRGYDTDEVDEFLEKVAVAVDEMHQELTRLASRGEPALRAVEDVPAFDDDAIRRTLVLAQRTADLAIGEAREEADRLLAEARTQSEALLAQTQEAVRRLRDEAEQEVQARVGRLRDEHDRLERDVAALASKLDGERARLVQGLSAALAWVEESMSGPAPTAAASKAMPAPAPVGSSPDTPPSSTGGKPDAAVSPQVGVATGAKSEPGSASGSLTRPGTPFVLPDVEAEIREDAETARRRDVAPAASEGRPSPVRSDGTVSFSPPPALDADDALWARWASGEAGDGGSVAQPGRPEGTLSFDRSADRGRGAS